MISEFPIIRLGFFLGLLGLMFIIETFWPARAWLDSRKDRLKFSIGLALINNVVMKVFISTPFILWANFVGEKGWGLVGLLGLTGIAEILATLVVFDFFDAIKHLCFHRIAFMWRFHRVHHTDRHLDILTALRYHPGEMIISAIWKAAWILIWGPSVLAFTIFEIALNMSSEFHHSNISLGRFENILNKFYVTPRYHALHHTIHRDRGDQNFSTIFSWWDRLLGSFANPATETVDLERLGTLQDNHLNLKAVLLSPVVDPKSLGGYKSEEVVSSKNHFNDLLLIARKSIQDKKAILVDVREEKEMTENKPISNAYSFPYSGFKSNKEDYLKNLIEIIQDQQVYLYCAAGIRSGKIERELLKFGINAKNLGGIQDCFLLNQ